LFLLSDALGDFIFHGAAAGLVVMRPVSREFLMPQRADPVEVALEPVQQLVLGGSVRWQRIRGGQPACPERVEKIDPAAGNPGDRR
jgi:hypothetical protein